jgi:phosphate-selective porin OprO/OprP
MTGKMFGDWMYKLEVDFGRDTGTGTVATKEAWIKYIGLPNAEFLVGNVPVPFGLEDYTTDLFVTFIERALPSPVFAPERLLGGVAGYYGPNWSVAGGVYGRSADDPTNVTNEGDQQFVSTGRVTFDPILDKDELVHLGLGVFYKNPSDQPISFSTKPESNVTAVKFLNTGAIANVDHLVEIDPELALIYGPASFQGEYFWVPVTRTEPSGSTLTPSVDLTGWYAQFSYFLTGESRNYNPKIAKFDRITPFHNLGPSGIGAIELAARVSQLSLDDGPRFQFGTERDYTLGVNWYVNPYIRFMMDYIWVRNNASATGNAANLLPGNTSAGYDDPSILELRAQVDW